MKCREEPRDKLEARIRGAVPQMANAEITHGLYAAVSGLVEGVPTIAYVRGGAVPERNDRLPDPTPPQQLPPDPERQRADEPYVPDFTIIPDELAKYAEADESAEDFRRRAFNLLFRFGIAEGENFEGGGEPLTPEEKIKLLPMLIANFNAGNWLKLIEDLNPQA